MNIPGTNAHLTYCLNVYPARSVEDIKDNVFIKAAAVKRALESRGCVDTPFGIGLWIPAFLIDGFREASFLNAFKQRLTDQGMYVFTLNGFPFGRFHAERVKENVYKPDWSTDKRMQYTIALADVLAQLLPENVTGSISTLPVTFKPWADPALIEEAVSRLMDSVVHLSCIQEQKGRHIGLALEPEPGCFLEHTNDTTRFFEQEIFTKGSAYLEKQHNIQADTARQIITSHLGICLDTTHAGVMFEDPCRVIEILVSHDITVFKLHLGAAVTLDTARQPPRKALAAFNDDVYLHQTSVLQESGKTLFFMDLPEALRMEPDGNWRVHYHVPLSSALQGAIETTSSLVNDELFQAALKAGVKHYEVEIYTLNILPGFSGSIEKIMTRELEWVLSRISAGYPSH